MGKTAGVKYWPSTHHHLKNVHRSLASNDRPKEGWHRASEGHVYRGRNMARIKLGLLADNFLLSLAEF